jgi:hypothetical protein
MLLNNCVAPQADPRLCSIDRFAPHSDAIVY